MSLLPRLYSGISHFNFVGSTEAVSTKFAFLFSRWRKRLKGGIQLTTVAGKHGGKLSIPDKISAETVAREDVLPETVKTGFLKFDEMISERREQARRSLVVQVQSEASCLELREYIENISPVNCMFHYKLKENHFVLVEFKDNCLQEILLNWCHVSDKSTVPVASPVVWFKAAQAGRKRSGQEITSIEDSKVIRVSPPPSYETILNLTSQIQRVSPLMETLHACTKLDELGTRLRFFTARQVELAMSGLFPHCAVLPFGSSVNGFGKSGSDLDLIFRHDLSQHETSMGNSNRSLRLVYQTKTSLGGPRPLTQRQMELMADLLQVLMPGCSGVKRILQARVPIVKYSNDFTGLDCDLSMSNMTGLYMSELLFLYSQLDPMSKLLICFVKTWAAACLLTNPSPGRWITNFMLIMLCIHYLQSLKRLPPLDVMVKAAGPEDERVTDDINCTFARDLSRLNWNSSCPSLPPSKILKGFFEYYMNYDFGAYCVSITTEARLTKPDYSPLYIVNPLERSLNVSKNVSGEELEKLKMALRNAAWVLESGDLPVNSLLTRLGQNSNPLPPLLQTGFFSSPIPHASSVEGEPAF
ncbi:hypothetical protein GE061_001766 [Apolygus lucorum]|uniref:Poly(A) RNA polymerase mitochondrial-like central palm domain-containing protein n=1 Tax=Apolygus lucorum TaxID=248454 RepID=A0A6A4J839_APOLU|nr:hypothetical protein GE061_001766 [Apolygus lucorum]